MIYHIRTKTRVTVAMVPLRLPTLATLMPNKHIFLLTLDIAMPWPYRRALDNALQQGDIQQVFNVYNTFRCRAPQLAEYEERLLQRDIEHFEFTLDESGVLGRNEAPWPAERASF